MVAHIYSSNYAGDRGRRIAARGHLDKSMKSYLKDKLRAGDIAQVVEYLYNTRP
jgi:hypothetical protein